MTGVSRLWQEILCHNKAPEYSGRRVSLLLLERRPLRAAAVGPCTGKVWMISL